MNIFHIDTIASKEGTIGKCNVRKEKIENAFQIIGTSVNSIAVWQYLLDAYSHFSCSLGSGAYTESSQDIKEAIGNTSCSILLTDKHLLPNYANDNHLTIISNTIQEDALDIKDVDKLSLIGIQKHLCQSETFRSCQDSMFNFLRLSDVRRDMALCEVLLRDSKHIIFDMNAIRQSDFPVLQRQASVCGFTTEEACQLMKFCGSVQGLSSIEITNIDFTQSMDSPYYELIGMLCWYLFEGSNFKEQSSGISHKKQYVVYPDSIDLPLYFYNESMTNRWWVNTNDEMDELIACSPNDYEDVRNGVLSDRMMKIVERLNC